MASLIAYLREQFPPNRIVVLLSPLAASVAAIIAAWLADHLPFIADQVAINYRKADITSRQRAMLDFAMQVALQSHTVSDDDIARLEPHGFSREDVWDIAAIAAFFAMSNRLANVTSMRPNDEFYKLGR